QGRLTLQFISISPFPRCENLAKVNTLLREHLDKANEVNLALKEDVGKLTADWMRAREELELKESEWRSEREFYDSYLRGEHNRLLKLWRQVLTFRRHFLEMKTATDRDLSELKAEQMRLSGSILVSCFRLNSGVQLWESVTLGRPVPKDQEQQQVEKEIDQKALEVMCLQGNGDQEKKELQDRVMELSALLVQSQKQNEEKEKTVKTLNDTVEMLVCFTFIWEVAQCLLGLSNLFSSLSIERCGFLKRKNNHLVLLSCPRSDCENLEKIRGELQQKLKFSEQEASHLRQSNTELQLKEDSAQGEKVEQQLAMERAHHDHDLKDLAALEAKHSSLQSELIATREKLEEAHLQRDLLKQEKHELTVALEKAEKSVAALTGAQNKLNSEIADLHVAAAKMSSINEALALDKVELNKLVLQVSSFQQCKAFTSSCSMFFRLCMTLYKRTNEELCAEKSHLEELLKKAEEQQEELQMQLRILAEEKEETQEKLNQVYRQQESASSGLEQLRQQSSRQEDAVAKVSKEKEFLVHEKAALEVQLAAVERDRQGLSEQLAEARSVKDTLESSLFEAQQHSSHLEVTKSQLEIQLHTIIQAKEVIQGEVMCLQYELETERSLMKQEREDMAQRLIQIEQQHNNTLKLQQTDHEVEINKLLQDLASEREGRQLELQEMLELWEKEKAETEGQHEKKLFHMKEKVATMQAQQEEERTRFEKKENEKKALLETLLQTQGELTAACHQLEQLRQEVKEQQEYEQVGFTSRVGRKFKQLVTEHKLREGLLKPEASCKELTSQLAASEESHQAIGHKAQQDLNEAQELSRQKVLEVVHLQKILEEERGQWEEVEHQNKELQVLAALSLRLCASVLQVQTLQEVVLEKEASLAAREKQLLQDLEESRAGERCLKDSLHVLEAEMAELHLRLCSTENRAKALATECQQANNAHCEAQSQLDKLHLVLHHVLCDSTDKSRDLVSWRSGKCGRNKNHIECLGMEENMEGRNVQDLELELSERQAERDHFSARNQELQKQLAQSQEGTASFQPTESILSHWKGFLIPHRGTVLQFIKDIKEKNQKTEFQQEQIQELEKQQELQRTAVSKMSKDLEDRDKEIKSQQEEIWELEKQRELQRTAIGKMTKDLAHRDQEIRFQQEEIRELEKQRELQRTAASKMSKDLKERDEKIRSQKELIEELEKQQELQRAALGKMNKNLEERDQAIRSQQELIEELKRHQEMQRSVVNKMHKDLEERDGNISSQQELIEELEKHQELQRAAVSKMNKDLEERDEKIRSQQEIIEELERQQELQTTVVSKMSKNLEDRDQEIKSLQELIEELEKQQEMQRSAVSKMSKDLEERDQEIRSQQEEIQELEKQRELQRTVVSKMSKDLEERDQMIKFQEGKLIILEQHGTSQVRSLLMDLDHMKGNLKEKDLELIFFQQYKEHQEEYLQELQDKVEKMKLSLSKKDQELESQKKQIQEAEEKDLMIESQKELIETFQKQEKDSMQQKEILQHLKGSLKEQEQETVSLKKQCEAFKEMQEKHRTDQVILQETKMTLKERERTIEVLEEAVSKLQQQNDDMMMQTAAVVQKLECAESSLAARDQEIASLKEHVQELQEQKESEAKQARSLQQDLNKMNKTMKENNLEILKQSEQINVFHIREESMKVALMSCQNQVSLLEEVVRKRDEDNETLLQKLQHQEEELKTLQNLQLMLSEKKEEIKHHGEEEKFLEEALHGRERETEAQGEQKKLEDEEIRGLHEDLQHVQQTLTKKDEEIKCQRDRVKYLERTLTGKEKELRRQSELLKQLTSALHWKDEGETLKKQIQKLQKWEEEEAEKKRALQERDQFLKRQKELAQQLEDERKVKGEELKRVIAILKQTESGEIEWKEKAQALTLALSKSEMTNGTLREEIAILQSMVSERDKDRFHLQVGDVTGHQSTKMSVKDSNVEAIGGSENLSWLLEKKLLWQRLECLQQAVARLEHEKSELTQLNAELRITLEQVKKAFTASAVQSDEDKMPDGPTVWVSLNSAFSLFQVTLLQQQLAQERKYKQDYIECCAKTSQELLDLHQELSYSLETVVREPKAAVLEAETQKLDRSLNHTLALISLDCRSPERQLLHSAVRSTTKDGLR
uniref:Centrosomal protein 250 n=1 Tax=Phasianus colchicus TaxID=9054 RepID=A0A669QQS9_PHACC